MQHETLHEITCPFTLHVASVCTCAASVPSFSLSMPPKRIGAAAAAAGTPPPPAIDTSMAAISKLETQLAKLKPILYSKQNLSDSLRQLHELESHADSIYKANNLGPDEEVPAKDVLDAIRAVAAAISASGDTPLLTSEQIKSSKLNEEKQLAAQEAAHRARYSPTKAPKAPAGKTTRKKHVSKPSSADFVATAAAVRASLTALSSAKKKGRGAKRSRSSKKQDGSDDEEDDEHQSEPDLDDEPEEDGVSEAADETVDDPFAFTEKDAVKPAKGKKAAAGKGAKLNGSAHAAATTVAAASPVAAAASSSKKAASAASSNGHSHKKNGKKSSESPAAAASPRTAAAPAAKKAKTAAARTTAATSNGSTTRTTRSGR